MTDEHPSFSASGATTSPHRVNHSAGEYVRNFCIHTNGIESVWALLQRQIIGTHHFLSPKHLSRYLDEMTWRFNRRELGEGERVNVLLAQCGAGQLQGVDRMSDEKEYDKEFGVDLSFDEAMERFVSVTKEELAEAGEDTGTDLVHDGESQTVLFKHAEVRKVFLNGEWLFSIVDCIAVVIESAQWLLDRPKDAKCQKRGVF